MPAATAVPAVSHNHVGKPPDAPITVATLFKPNQLFSTGLNDFSSVGKELAQLPRRTEVQHTLNE